MAIHLSNTHLQWPFWQYWSDEYQAAIAPSDSLSNNDNGNLQQLFLNLLIGQTTRLSLSERMMKILPSPLHAIIPKEEYDYSPKCSHYILQSGTCGGKGSLMTVANELNDKLLQRESLSSMEIVEWLLNNSHEGVDDNFQQNGWRLVLFLESLLCRGSLTGGTISGMIGLVDRYASSISSFDVSFPPPSYHEAILELTLNYDDGYQVG